MYVQPDNPESRIWDGPRSGLAGAVDLFGAAEAKHVSKFEEWLSATTRSEKAPTLFSDLPLTTEFPPSPLDGTAIKANNASAVCVSADDSSVSSAFINYKPGPVIHDSSPSSTPTLRNLTANWMHGDQADSSSRLKPLAPIIDNLRLYKSPSEIALMRQAGRVSAKAFLSAMRMTRPGITEHQISATLEYQARMHGASGLAYVPVVAGGRNALILHYVQNQQMLKDGDLLLVDAGAEYAGYCSDVTRTWPVNGKFSEPQRQLYQILLHVQKYMISQCNEKSNTSLNQLHNESFFMLKDGLTRLFGRSIGHSEMETLYPHHLGHWLGMDVHDTASISRNTVLKEGMVVTIEPGIYIPDSPLYPDHLRGLAVRIEDDVAVGGASTHYSPVILSVDTPKEIVDIEAVMAGLV
eukprot:jgi/Hompol1/4210/HPOL_003517-RA